MAVPSLSVGDTADYSPLMSAALMIGHPFSISALRNAPSASGAGELLTGAGHGRSGGHGLNKVATARALFVRVRAC
jgi:hypothetical protein